MGPECSSFLTAWDLCLGRVSEIFLFPVSAGSVYRHLVGTDYFWSMFWCISGYSKKSLSCVGCFFFLNLAFSILDGRFGCGSYCFIFWSVLMI